MKANERLVRFPLEVELLKRIDRLILSGSGGFDTRTSFFKEAALLLLDEYAHANVDGGPPFEDLAAEVALEGVAHGDPIALDDTIVRAPERPEALLSDSVAGLRPQMLFGLHNRDYPSIWALRQIFDIAGSAPRDLDESLRLVTAEAWRFGARLLELEQRVGQKLTALFPTNASKRQSADDAFRNFAIGGCAWTGEGLVAAGPLFEWRVCALSRAGTASGKDDLRLGVTKAGLELLQKLDGISLRLPHDQTHAIAFFEHLRIHDPADLDGFDFVVRVISREVTRDELVQSFAGHLDQRQDQAPTYAAGYVARAREWGLVEPKQRAGRYALTAFGEEFAGSAVGGAK